VLEYQHSYLRPRTDLPGSRSPDGMPNMVSGDLLSHLRDGPQLTMVAYSPLLRGGYVGQDKLDAAEFAEFDHPGTPARLAALREVARDAGATVNQVVLAWPNRRAGPDNPADRCLLGSTTGREPGRSGPGTDHGTAHETGRGPVTTAAGTRTIRPSLNSAL